MKITNVTAYPVEDGRKALFVVVDTDEGVWGVGESGVSSHPRAVMGALEALKPRLIGQDAFRIGHIWQSLMRGGFFPGMLVISAAVSAVDIALWDIKGKALGVPIYDLLAGRQRDKVPCYPHCQVGSDQASTALIESCQEHIEKGWKFVRWGASIENGTLIEPREAVRRDIAVMEDVRSAIGPDIEICFDAHTRYDLPEAVWFCRAVEPLEPFFVEDPLRSENPDSFKTLRPRSGVPLASGEQFGGKFQFRQLIEEEWIDYARTDLCIVGGISEAWKIAGWCEAHYIKMATHNPLSPVSSAACFQLNMAISNLGVQEQPRMPGEVMTNVIPEQIGWEDGSLVPNGKPGLGITFDRQAAEKLCVSDWGEPRPLCHRRDGGFTNW